MTLEEKVGQLFLARCPEENAATLAAQYHLGGYVLFARDFEEQTPESMQGILDSYRSAPAIPMLLAVDEEGGTVNRISRFSSFRSEPFLSPQALYKAGGLDAVSADTVEKCAFLSSLGLNVNMAPVCDVPASSRDFIYERSFGSDAAATSDYVQTVVSAMGQGSIGSVLKHFPGYGPNGDTHSDLVHDDRPLSQFEECDFLPFQAGIEAGADAVLVSHNIVSVFDPDCPASLSPAVHELLRSDFAFDGVLITDDLAMEGVAAFAPGPEVAVRALQAGNDLLCTTDFIPQYEAVLQAAREGELSVDALDRSVLRILLWKIRLGLIPAGD